MPFKCQILSFASRLLPDFGEQVIVVKRHMSKSPFILREEQVTFYEMIMMSALY